MGVNFYRFRLKSGVEPASLETLIEQQAVAFQSMWGGPSSEEFAVKMISVSLSEHLHRDTYHTASKVLRNRIELPEWDDENQCAVDLPDLVPSWRVYPITYNRIFPPLCRMQAYRTFLPGQLGTQIPEWRKWIQEVLAGEHDDYLRSLHLYETSRVLQQHWSRLHGCACASLEKTTNWTRKPELIEVREQILRLREPCVMETRISASEPRRPVDDEICAEFFENVGRVLDLTREWDRRVPGKWKVGYYPKHYEFTLDEFKKNAEDDWLQEFFAWGDHCIERGFGWFLDY